MVFNAIDGDKLRHERDISTDTISLSESEAESEADNKPKNILKVSISYDKDTWVFMVADVKFIADIETEIFFRYPELCLKTLTYYYRGNLKLSI